LRNRSPMWGTMDETPPGCSGGKNSACKIFKGDSSSLPTFYSIPV
jgi:hypothetical protein